MEIILIKDVPNLGLKNDVVTVKNGYGVNYLIPQGFAVAATASEKKQLAETMKQRAHKEEKLKNEAIELAEKINSISSLSIGTKASSTGKIFGSVNTIQIAEALTKQGYDVDRRKITLKESNIKELGSYSCKINLYKGVQVELQFEVVAE